LDQPVRIGCGDDDLADLIGCRWHPAPSIRQPAPWPSIPVNGVAQRAPGNGPGMGGMAMVVLAGAGSRAVTSRPPSGSARAWVSPPWVRATERTIDRPRPVPPADEATRPARRRNGSNSDSTRSGDGTAAVGDPHDRPPAIGAGGDQPLGRLWGMAFSIRLGTIRSRRAGAPATGAGSGGVAR